MDAIAADDVWAVGCCAQGRISTFHWNGARWRSVAVPLHTGLLLSVDGVSSSDVWATGFTGILHWDGTRWSTSKSLEEPLESVSADSSDDAWAVGGVSDGQGGETTVALHWDGHSWRRDGPSVPGLFTDVSALSPTDVWAVGEVRNTSGLIEHWDGSSWHEVTSPDPNFSTASVTALSPTDVWIVGQGPSVAETEHWDGTRLTVVPCPRPAGYSELIDVNGSSGNDIWAVGERDDAEKYHPLTMHWDGTTWSQVKAPPVPHHKTWLTGVAAIAPADAWSVGYHLMGDRTDYQVLAHWDGSSWHRLR